MRVMSTVGELQRFLDEHSKPVPGARTVNATAADLLARLDRLGELASVRLNDCTAAAAKARGITIRRRSAGEEGGAR